MFTDTNPAMQLAAAFSWFSSPQAKVLYSRIAKYSKLTLIGIAQYSLVLISLTALLIAYVYNELTDKLMQHCTQSESANVEIAAPTCETHETQSEIITQEQQDDLDEFFTFYDNICSDYDALHSIAELEQLAIAHSPALNPLLCIDITEKHAPIFAEVVEVEKPLTKREMLSICKAHKVPGYSRLNAEALTQKLVSLGLYSRRFIPIE